MNAFILGGTLINAYWGSSRPWSVKAEFDNWCRENLKGHFAFSFVGQDDTFDPLIFSNYMFLVELDEDAVLLKLAYNDDLRLI